MTSTKTNFADMHDLKLAILSEIKQAIATLIEGYTAKLPDGTEIEFEITPTGGIVLKEELDTGKEVLERTSKFSLMIDTDGCTTITQIG